ncbi:MAG: FAD:protein FMN transferase [Rudaea sp.]
MESVEFRAMNSNVLLAADGAAGEVQEGFRRARALVEAYEARWSRFSDENELAALNRSAGHWYDASPELYAILSMSREYNSETSGLFDPAVLDALIAAGYDRSMDEIRANGGKVAERGPDGAANHFSVAQIELDPSAQRVRLPRGLHMDLGGIAKGWIAERAAEELGRFSRACVANAGGDLFTIGLPDGEPHWRIELEDPRLPEQTLAVLRVGPGGVATSSVLKRQWQQGEQPRHHLIDPRTCLPATTDWLSVTAIAPYATTAEVYAKALLIAGSAGAERLAESRPELNFVAVDKEGALWGSAGAKELLDVGFENA